MRIWLFLVLCPLVLFGRGETVVLIHGLAADSGTMSYIEHGLEAEGYDVANLDYPSMSQSLEELAKQLAKDIAEQTKDAETVHFVTHSMGGIVLRIIQRDAPVQNIGRVVMISPPNHGSDAVNILADVPGALWAMGPAGRTLAAGDNELLSALGPADFEVGIIAGSLGVDAVMSSLIPGPDDGVVSVESTKLEGMADHIVIHEAHPIIVFNGEAIDQTIWFLDDGKFHHPSEKTKDKRRSRK